MRMPRNGLVILLLAVMCGWSAWADTILLKNGNRLQGRIVSESGSELIIEVAFGKLTLPKDQIAKIMRDSPVESIVQQGERLLSLGAIEHALAYFDKAIAEHPDHAGLRQTVGRAYLYAAEKYMANKQMSLARQCAELARAYDKELTTTELLAQVQQYEAWGRQQMQQAVSLFHSQPAAALQKMVELLEIFPEWEGDITPSLVQAALAAGDQAYGGKNYAQAAALYDTALKYQPEILRQLESRWMTAHLNWVVTDYINKSQWQPANETLAKVLRVLPSCQPAFFLLGLVAERQGDNRGAFAWYRKVLGQSADWSGNLEQLALVRGQAQKAAGIGSKEPEPEEETHQEQAPTGKWSELKTAHFHIYHENLRLAQQAADTLEYHWQNIQQRLAPSGWQSNWRKTCQVYIHPSEQQYSEKTGMPGWSNGVTRQRFEQGRLYQQSIHVYQGAQLLLASVLPHELTHVMVPWFLAYRHEPTLWLGEGLATSSEAPFQQTQRRRTLQSALRRGKLFPLARLFQLKDYPQEKHQVDIFYAQSFALVEFLLRTYGADALWQFTANIRALPIEQNLQQAFGIAGMEELEKSWRKSLVNK